MPPCAARASTQQRRWFMAELPEFKDEAPLPPAMARLERLLQRVLKNVPMLETLAEDSRHKDAWEQYRHMCISSSQRAGVVEPRKRPRR